MRTFIKNKILLYILAITFWSGCTKDEKQEYNPNEPIAITSFLPDVGRVGTRIIINGSNFTNDLSRIKVSINGKYLPIIGANANQIMAVVHDKLGTGLISVEIDNKVVSSASEFKYIFTRSVTTLAGDGSPGFANGAGAQAKFSFKNAANAWYRGAGIVVDSKENVFVVDPGNTCIRKIDASGVVTTFVGNPNQAGNSDGKGTAATFTLPYGLAIDEEDNLYTVDPGTWAIKKVTPDGTVTTLAYAIREPWYVAFDKKTKKVFYVSNSSGDVCKLEDNGTSAVVISGLSAPMGIDFDGDGNLYVVESGQHVIRRFEANTWTSSVISGRAGQSGLANGTVNESLYTNPAGLCVGADGVVYVAGNATWDGGDYNADQSIRFISPNASSGWVTATFAGSGIAGFTNEMGTSASFSGPLGVAVSRHGTVYVLDKSNNAVRKITSE